VDDLVPVFNTIMWATDGSAAAEQALPYAKSLAARDGAKLVVAHTVETFTGSRAAGLTLYADEDAVEAKLEELIAELEGEGLDASLKIVTRAGVHPAHALADIAEEVGADLIVVGTRGHTVYAGLLLGSVTHRLLHIVSCPVMAVPPARSA
jgi:nucleotide-binding universal stress UspA family protein